MREALERDGYVVVAGVLGAREVERLRRAFESAPEQERGTRHVAVSDETPEREAWSALAAHALVREAAACVLGAADGAERAFVVRDLHGREPLRGFGQQGLHSDWRPIAAGERFAVATLIWMLDDFTEQNGATRVVPGTHRVPGMVPRAMAQPLAHHPEERVVVGRAGDVLVMNGHVWHSGRKNESGARRRAVQMVVIAADAAGAFAARR